VKWIDGPKRALEAFVHVERVTTVVAMERLTSRMHYG